MFEQTELFWYATQNHNMPLYETISTITLRESGFGSCDGCSADVLCEISKFVARTVEYVILFFEATTGTPKQNVHGLLKCAHPSTIAILTQQ
jgi:hypothetical protein